MRHPQIHFTVGIFVIAILLAIPATAQETAQERAANLRTKLTETQEKQADLQLRLQQLEEDSKPENIERTFAGIGSTHPEELREARRRQLEIQKRGVQTQLETLAAGRTRLEAALARADTEAYHQSAKPSPNTADAPTNAVTPTSKVQRPRKYRPKKRRS